MWLTHKTQPMTTSMIVGQQWLMTFLKSKQLIPQFLFTVLTCIACSTPLWAFLFCPVLSVDVVTHGVISTHTHTHTHTSFPPSQSSQRIQLIPLSNFSPNTSADEHCLSDNEHPEQLYSLGKFVAVTPQYQSQLPPAPHGKIPAGRRGTQSATTADPRWTPVLLESADNVSSPEVKRKKGRSYLPQKGQRSHTFSANRSDEQEDVRTILSTVTLHLAPCLMEYII